MNSAHSKKKQQLFPKLKFNSNSRAYTLKCLKDFKNESRKILKAGPFGSALKKEDYVISGYKIYGQEQVINDDAFFGNYFITEEKFQKLKSCEVQPGDLLISLGWNVREDIIDTGKRLEGNNKSSAT
jgi:hypothetical protein